jgi:hypothetical protein
MDSATAGWRRMDAGWSLRPMIFLFTDFGLAGPYTGQMKAVLYARAPGVPVVDLFADAPAQHPKAAAYLLAAYSATLPPDSVFLSVVDPGVGGERPPVVLRADGRWFVGPGNGLFEIVCRRARLAEAWRIEWKPDRLSATFHGRDIFAPVAATMARGEPPPGTPLEPSEIARPDWPDDLFEIVYIDHYGNAMAGARAAALAPEAWITVNGQPLPMARKFSDVPVGTAFWYENSNGLLEIAVNQGRAADRLRLAVGTPVAVR